MCLLTNRDIQPLLDHLKYFTLLGLSLPEDRHGKEGSRGSSSLQERLSPTRFGCAGGRARSAPREG